MNWIDVAVVVVWCLTAVWGLSAGLVRMSISLLVVLAGLALSSRIADDVGSIFARFTDDEGARAVGAFIVIFLALIVIGAILSFWIGAMLRFLPVLGAANRLGGLALGLAIGFVLLSGTLTGVQKFTDAVDEDIHESVLGAFLADNFDVVIRGARLIPGDWDDELQRLQ